MRKEILMALLVLGLAIPVMGDANGVLRIDSEPQGADVYLWTVGNYVGTTPFYVTADTFPINQYLRISKDGYWNGTFAIFPMMFKQPYVKAYMVKR